MKGEDSEYMYLKLNILQLMRCFLFLSFFLHCYLFCISICTCQFSGNIYLPSYVYIFILNLSTEYGHKFGGKHMRQEVNKETMIPISSQYN